MLPRNLGFGASIFGRCAERTSLHTCAHRTYPLGEQITYTPRTREAPCHDKWLSGSVAHCLVHRPLAPARPPARPVNKSNKSTRGLRPRTHARMPHCSDKCPKGSARTKDRTTVDAFKEFKGRERVHRAAPAGTGQQRPTGRSGAGSASATAQGIAHSSKLQLNSYMSRSRWRSYKTCEPH